MLARFEAAAVRRVLLLVVVLCAALVGGLVMPATAEPTLEERQRARQEAEQREAELREQRQQIEQQEAEAQADVEEALAREAELRRQRDDAEARLVELRQNLADAVDAYQTARAELAAIEEELAKLEASVARLMEAVADREEQVGHIIRGMYKGGGQVAGYEAVLRAEAIAEAARQLGYLRGAQESQEEIISALVADRRRLEGEQEKVAQAREEQEAVAAELQERQLAVEEQVAAQEAEVADLEAIVADAEAELAELEQVLAGASAELASVRAEEKEASGQVAEAKKAEEAEKERIAEEKRKQREEEQRVAATNRSSRNSSGSGGSLALPSDIACPVGGNLWFMDTWGTARSQGRSHEGTDMFADMRDPIYAYESGTVRLGKNTLGGVVLYLMGDSGNRYYYAHLAEYVSGLSNGQRVSVGEQIGYNGKSGNARTTPPHLHIEVRPGGGSKVNPYPYMKRACG